MFMSTRSGLGWGGRVVVANQRGFPLPSDGDLAQRCRSPLLRRRSLDGQEPSSASGSFGAGWRADRVPHDAGVQDRVADFSCQQPLTFARARLAQMPPVMVGPRHELPHACTGRN